MYKAKALMEDFKMQAIAGMQAASILWQKAILQTLLSGCGAWIGIGEKIHRMLDEIQNNQLQMIYYCPLSTPEPSLVGMQNMKHRIWLKKLCVVARILYTKQETENYARLAGTNFRGGRDLPAGWST